MESFLKKIWSLVKKKFWYLILLGVSSAYVCYYRFDIYQLKELNAQNLIFIIWLLLLLLPLFSEMEFLGVKVKKEVEKATEEVKSSLQNLQTQIGQLQMTNSVANTIQLGNGLLPSERKLEESLEFVRELQRSNVDANFKREDPIPIPIEKDKSTYLFKIRLEIETTLRELCEKIGYTDKMPIVKMAQLLNRAEILRGMTSDLINQVCKIANRGVHGEIVSNEYVTFVEETFPEIMRQLKEASARLKYITDCPRCKYVGYSVYENVCPKCGYVYDCD